MLPLVLLPAMLCDAELYAAQAAALSDVAEISVAPVADRALADAARTVLVAAPPRFALAGTSAGGNLALEIVAQAPDRVAGLWLMGSNPGPHGDPDGARAQSARVRAGEFETVVEELAARAVYEGGRLCALERLTAPTLLLWGRHDQFSGVDRALAIAAGVPSASLVVLDACGHLPTLEHPDDTARAWLDTLD